MVALLRAQLGGAEDEKGGIRWHTPKEGQRRGPEEEEFEEREKRRLVDDKLFSGRCMSHGVKWSHGLGMEDPAGYLTWLVCGGSGALGC